MTDQIPDRLSVDPRSPHFQQDVLQRGIGVKFKGVERTDVEEYSISEGWVRVALPRKTGRDGRPLTIKLTGPVEAWFQSPADGDATGGDATGGAADEQAAG